MQTDYHTISPTRATAVHSLSNRWSTTTRTATRSPYSHLNCRMMIPKLSHHAFPAEESELPPQSMRPSMMDSMQTASKDGDGKVVTTAVDESSSASIYGDSTRLSPTTRLTLEDGIWHHSQPRTRYRKPVSMMQTTQTCIIPSTSRIPSGSQPMLLIDLSFASCRRLAAFSLITPTASQPRRILTLESNN